MTVQAFINPLPYFPGLDGQPMTGGYVYIGQPNQDPRQSPLAVYYDEALTVPATQPLRTTGGFLYRNGAPTNVWADGNCSVMVLDPKLRQVYYIADWSGTFSSLSAAAAAAAAPYVTAASTSATNAATSATNAATSATNASNSASAAAASAAAAVQAPGVVGFDTLANLNANLNFADKSVAYVTNDSPSNNGIYRKSGASGAGSWVQQSTFTTNYAGVAVPATNPGAQGATSRIVYTAITPGTYTNFASLVVNTGEIAALRWTGAAWTKDVIFTFNTPNVILGEVVKGGIYPFDTGVSTQVAIKVQPGTVIAGYNDTKKVHVTVTSGTNLLIDSATTHPGINATGTGLLYCSLAGALGITNGTTNLPSGEYVLIGYIYQAGVATGSGVSSAFLPVAPILPSNHYFYGRANDMMAWPKQATRGLRVNVKDLGAVGDGVTDDSQAILLWHWLIRAIRAQQTSNGWWGATKSPYELFFPAGTYLTTLFVAEADGKVVGESKTGSVIKCASLLSTSIFQAEDITLWNVAITAGASQPDLARYIRTLFKYDAGLTNSSTYLVNPGTKDYEVRECEWQYGTVFIPLYVTNFHNVMIDRNIFNSADTGYASHAMRLENPSTAQQNVIVRQNWVWNGTTGIFFGGNRVRPTENVIVEGNRLYHIQEEAIAFDNFGNNTGLCPVIGSGTITAATNDGNGRLVITPALKYNPAGTPNITLNVSDRSDWTNFYFTFEGGNGSTSAISEGLDGSYVKIISYDGVGGTLTLDSYTLATDVATGGSSLCGVHGGFFNVTVRDNVIEGSVGTAGATLHTYATAISVFLNVFGFRVHGNTIIGCAGGINVAGGQMLTTYRSLAWNNHVYENNFVNCTRLDAVAQDQGVFRFESYGATVNQYNNSFSHNKVIGGNRAKLVRQRNFTYSQNDAPSITNFVRQWCAQSLPTAGPAWAGRVKELITEDGSGNATDIHYYMCKAVAGVYSWVQIA